MHLSQGTGKKNLEKQLENLELKYPGKVRCVMKFNVPLAHMITGGADFMLVPSRFEPCGLIQLHAMRYGTVCILYYSFPYVNYAHNRFTCVSCVDTYMICVDICYHLFCLDNWSMSYRSLVNLILSASLCILG
jgi:hypothetical protein